MLIGEMLQTYRNQERFGTREYAKMIGISHATLNRIENGKDVDAKTLLKLIEWVFND